MSSDLKICHLGNQASFLPDHHICFFRGNLENLSHTFPNKYEFFSPQEDDYTKLTPPEDQTHILLDPSRFSILHRDHRSHKVTVTVQDLLTSRNLSISAETPLFDHKNYRFSISLFDPVATSTELMLQISQRNPNGSTFHKLDPQGCFVKSQQGIVNLDAPEDTLLPEARSGWHFPNLIDHAIWRTRFFSPAYVDAVVTPEHLEAAGEDPEMSRSFTVRFTELPTHRYFARFLDWILSIFNGSAEETH